jgi:hypothetical protein
MVPHGCLTSGVSTGVSHRGPRLSLPISGMGNVTSAGEFNFYTDPEAAHIVLTSACCPIYLLPWETCLSIDISLVRTHVLYVKI